MKYFRAYRTRVQRARQLHSAGDDILAWRRERNPGVESSQFEQTDGTLGEKVQIVLGVIIMEDIF